MVAIVGRDADIYNGSDVRGCGGVSLAGYVAVVSIDQWADEPLYVQLANILRARIRSGELRRLDRLPSEMTLVQEHGVSRDTVRQAVAVLRDEGLVFTLGQRGTYVGPKPS